MLWQTFFAALVSAFLHVGWNAAAKKRDEPGAAVLGVLFAASILSLLAWVAIILVVGPPPLAIWKWIVLAAPLAAAAYTALRAAYDQTEYALAYCLARGTIPPILAAFDVASGSNLHPVRFAGTGSILLGFMLFWFKAKQPGGKDVRGSALAVVSGTMLALSLYCDTQGMSVPGIDRTAGMEYAIATTFFSCLLGTIVGQIQAKRKELLSVRKVDGFSRFAKSLVTSAVKFDEPLRIVKCNTAFCFLAASAAIASFSIALLAYAQGPIWLVAALRETNVVFAGFVAVCYLHERITAQQWIGISLTSVGAIAIKIG